MAESQNTEWKRTWRDEYLKWICGFANAEGGVLRSRRKHQSTTHRCRTRSFHAAILRPHVGQRAGLIESWGRGIECRLDRGRQFGESTRAIEKQLAKLRQAGRITREGPDKGGRWYITEQSYD